MTSYLDQLREQTRLKQIADTSPKKQTSSGPPQLLDYNKPESKKVLMRVIALLLKPILSLLVVYHPIYIA